MEQPKITGGSRKDPQLDLQQVRRPRVVLVGKPGKAKKGSKVGKKGGRPESTDFCVVVFSPPFPPEYNPVPIRRCRRRWNQGAAVTNQAFSQADGHSQFLVVTNVTGAAVPFVDCWRIRRIWVWCISEGNIQTGVTLTPVGADNSSNNFNDAERGFSITSRSEAEPGHMCIKPSRDEPLGSWHFTSTVNVAGALFQMNITTGGGASANRTTLDIEFEYVENFLGLPLGYGRTTATTTLGAVGGENILSGFTLSNANNLG